MTIPKNTICLWYDGTAEEAAHFYAAIFPDSAVEAIHRSPLDNPGNKAGAVLVVHFIHGDGVLQGPRGQPVPVLRDDEPVGQHVPAPGVQ